MVQIRLNGRMSTCLRVDCAVLARLWFHHLNRTADHRDGQPSVLSIPAPASLLLGSAVRAP